MNVIKTYIMYIQFTAWYLLLGVSLSKSLNFYAESAERFIVFEMELLFLWNFYD